MHKNTIKDLFIPILSNNFLESDDFIGVFEPITGKNTSSKKLTTDTLLDVTTDSSK